MAGRHEGRLQSCLRAEPKESTAKGVVQASSHGESTSTLQFGARVSEITLGAARRNVESGMMLDAREASAKLQRETAAARAEAAAAQEALELERAEADELRMRNERIQQELDRLKVQS